MTMENMRLGQYEGDKGLARLIGDLQSILPDLMAEEDLEKLDTVVQELNPEGMQLRDEDMQHRRVAVKALLVLDFINKGL